MGRRSILVSGAGVAGPAAASWLSASGWDVTVVERGESVREDGQNVDVRGTGREVIDRMGLLEDMREHHTHETAMSFVDTRGRKYASFPSDASDVNSATADLEILRGQLSRMLYEHSAPSAEYVFGDHIERIHDDGEGVEVHFAGAASRRFDAVVLAEGSRSRTRDLVMPEAQIDELGIVWTYLTIPRTAADDRDWRLHVGGGGRVVHLRPDNVGTTRAMLSMHTQTRGLGDLGQEDMVAVLRATFGDLGWETPRVLAALDDAVPYVDAVAQVRLPQWHRGRVVLLGDAAWNAGPFGTGTTSAYVLAGELTISPDDVTAAFALYEKIMRPMTDHAQKFVPYNIHPRQEWQRRLLQTQLRAMGSGPGQVICRLIGFNPSPPVNRIELPDYPVLSSSHRTAGSR